MECRRRRFQFLLPISYLSPAGGFQSVLSVGQRRAAALRNDIGLERAQPRVVWAKRPARSTHNGKWRIYASLVTFVRDRSVP